MIVFDLQCSNGHVFEAWFGSSADFTSQKKRKLIACPYCGDTTVKKAVMAPNIGVKSNRKSVAAVPETAHAVATADPASGNMPSPAEIKRMFEVMAHIQKKVEETHEDVGDQFPEMARKIHYGEIEQKPIYGEATLSEAIDLQEEGIDVLPLPFRRKKSRRLDA